MNAHAQELANTGMGYPSSLTLSSLSVQSGLIAGPVGRLHLDDLDHGINFEYTIQIEDRSWQVRIIAAWQLALHLRYESSPSILPGSVLKAFGM